MVRLRLKAKSVGTIDDSNTEPWLQINASNCRKFLLSLQQKNTVWCFFYFSLFSALVWYFVEKPLLTFGRSWFG